MECAYYFLKRVPMGVSPRQSLRVAKSFPFWFPLRGLPRKRECGILAAAPDNWMVARQTVLPRRKSQNLLDATSPTDDGNSTNDRDPRG